MLMSMSNAPYTVSVVVDRDCGPCIRELLKTGPVWVIDSETNLASAQEIWAAFPDRDHLDGVTVFQAKGDQPPTQILIDQMDTIDMHHGVYSADPAYTVVRVIGTELVPEIR